MAQTTNLQETAAIIPATPAAQAAPPPFQIGKVLVITTGHLTHDIFSSFLSPLLPLLIQKLGLSLAMAGTLAAFQQLPSLLNPLLGVLADKGKLRWLVILAPSITAACMCLVGISSSYAFISLLLVCAGISTAIWHTSTPPVTARASGPLIGRGMSLFMIGGSLGYTIGPLLAVAAVSWWGLEGIWRLYPLALAASALLYWQIRDLEGFKGASRKGNGKWSESWQVLKRIMLPVTGIIIFQGFMQAALSTYLPIYLTNQGASLWIAGASLSIYEIAGAAGTLTAGTLSDRFSRRRVLGVALLTAPLLMLVFLVIPGWLAVPALLVIGFTCLSTTPVILALVNDYSHDHPATANGLYFAISFISRSLIVILIGAIADRYGLQPTFFGCALLGFASLPFVWLIPRRK